MGSNARRQCRDTSAEKNPHAHVQRKELQHIGTQAYTVEHWDKSEARGAGTPDNTYWTSAVTIRLMNRLIDTQWWNTLNFLQLVSRQAILRERNT